MTREGKEEASPKRSGACFRIDGTFQDLFAPPVNSATATPSNRSMQSIDDSHKHRFARTLCDLCDQITTSQDPTQSAVEVLRAVSGSFEVCDELTDLIREMLEVASLEARQ